MLLDPKLRGVGNAFMRSDSDCNCAAERAPLDRFSPTRRFQPPSKMTQTLMHNGDEH